MDDRAAKKDILFVSRLVSDLRQNQEFTESEDHQE